MGITLNSLSQLCSSGILSKTGDKVLDIGSSNLYQADLDSLYSYAQQFELARDGDLEIFFQTLSKGAEYTPESGGKNESFVGQLLERVGIHYEAIDIADGYRTTIFDLNHQQVPDAWKGKFDVVMNFGTTEHLLNQFNAFKVIHDATKQNGYMVHSLPFLGYCDHGYFTYTPRCMFDMAGYNNYEVVHFEFEGPGSLNDVYAPLRDYSSYFPYLNNALDNMRGSPLESFFKDQIIPNIALKIIYRKINQHPFVGALEMTTSVGAVPRTVSGIYAGQTQSLSKSSPRASGLLDWLRLFSKKR